MYEQIPKRNHLDITETVDYNIYQLFLKIIRKVICCYIAHEIGKLGVTAVSVIKP